MEIGAIVRDPVTDELVRVLLLAIDLGEQGFGTFELIEPARGRSEADLLIRELFQRILAKRGHGILLFRPQSEDPTSGRFDCLNLPSVDEPFLSLRRSTAT